MKKVLIGLLVLPAFKAYSANLKEAFYLESKKGNGYPDLLVSVFDDGTCSSESDNYDGRKAIDTYKCEVTDTLFINISGLSEIHCDLSAHFNGLDYEPEVSTLKREETKVYLDGVELIKAPVHIINKYKALKPCSNGIYRD